MRGLLTSRAFSVYKLISNGISKETRYIGCPKVSLKGSSNQWKSPLQLFSTSMDQEFSSSQKAVTTLKDEPDNDVKLKLYALFKQATIGKCNTPKPGALDFVGKAKWQAWNGLGEKSQAEAKKEYIDTVNSLLKAQGSDSPSNDTDSVGPQVEGLKLERKNGVLTITLNRPQKKNALTHEMYIGLTNILNETGNDKDVKFVVIKGAGDYFCSGNDLGNFTKSTNFKEMAKSGGIILKNYVAAYINFPKPLIGLVNGPAVGIAVTVLGLFDLVYASDKATFHTPFSALGQSPEGCSTYTFPKLMGYAKANEILMLNKRITAQEAKQGNLITEVFPDNKFTEQTNRLIDEIAALPHLSLACAKQATRNAEKDILHKVNSEECVLLEERWLSDDCMKAIMSFFQKGKSKM